MGEGLPARRRMHDRRPRRLRHQGAPPLIYLLPLVLELLLDTRKQLPFLPQRARRDLGWPLIVGGVVLNGWFLRTIREAEVPIRTDKPVLSLTTEGPFRYSRNPAILPWRWSTLG
jgi:protein-S-isoprenylcysteine O-methyltransferase Ste14